MRHMEPRYLIGQTLDALVGVGHDIGWSISATPKHTLWIKCRMTVLSFIGSFIASLFGHLYKAITGLVFAFAEYASTRRCALQPHTT
jgi:hypothetical protein